MTGVALLAQQIRFENRAFWRNPAAAFFVFAFPLMFLFLFPLIFGDGTITREGIEFTTVTFYVPSIAAFSIITAAYTNVAMSLVFSREKGVLKRKRGTPLPASTFIASRIIHSTIIGFLLVAIVVAVGVVFHDVSVPGDTAGAFLITIGIGTASFAALGLAITAFIPNEDAAPPIVNITILPLLFISDVFIPLQDSTPEWLRTVAEIFPVYHFAQATLSSYLGPPWGEGLEPGHLAVMAAWGVLGALIALRRFSWEPRR